MSYYLLLQEGKTVVGRIHRRVGDVLRVPFGEGVHSYAHVSTEPLVIFYDRACSDGEELPLIDIVELPVAFRILVRHKHVISGDWPRVGNITLQPSLLHKPYFHKQDNITGRLSIYHSEFSETNYERPASLRECKDLERAAVWDACHVEERLADHFAGIENKWVKMMRIDISKVPEDQKNASLSSTFLKALRLKK